MLSEATWSAVNTYRVKAISFKDAKIKKNLKQKEPDRIN